MDVKGLHDILKKRVDAGYGGDSIIVLDEEATEYSILTAEPDDDTESVVLNIELS